MKKWLSIWKSFRLRSLKAENVAYDEANQTITIRKGNIEVTLSAIVNLYPEDDDVPVVKISGDSIVLKNAVVREIWHALWNTQATTDAEKRPVYFSELKPHAEPTYMGIRKEEIIPMDY